MTRTPRLARYILLGSPVKAGHVETGTDIRRETAEVLSSKDKHRGLELGRDQPDSLERESDGIDRRLAQVRNRTQG